MADPKQSKEIKSLQEASWLNTPAIKAVFKLFNNDGNLLRVVGGAPRDYLLGRPVGDIDLATTLLPAEIIRRAEEAGLTAIPTGVEFGTVTVVSGGQSYEITTLRRDVETDGRHAVVSFGTDWHEDASRRDFTMNALYLSPDGTLHDPLGTGIEDLRAGKLRFIGCANKRIKEDHLRALRFYRFAAFLINPPYDETALSAIIQNRAGLRRLSAERVRAELFKLLSADNPIPALTSMYHCGVLTDILGTAPNINQLKTFIDLEEKLNFSAGPLLRLACLALWHRGDAARLAKRFRLSRNELAELNALSLYKQFPIFMPPAKLDKIALLKWHYKNGTKRYKALLMLALAAKNDQQNGDVSDWQNLLAEADQRTFPPFPVNGKDLIAAGMTPGPQLGYELERLEDHWLTSEMKLGKQQLMKLAGA
ncbi:MAG: cytidine(C)-cytidine(C)-adenosine (A)]-adding enzyme [Rhodomicrobium sp.]|nr:MAG: cytidine(C)-cytidine(C)-adenosine (A)]-adding enzyme [Rhodomicrobium sp.]